VFGGLHRWNHLWRSVSWPAAGVLGALQLNKLESLLAYCLAACICNGWNHLWRIVWRPAVVSAEITCGVMFGGQHLQWLDSLVAYFSDRLRLSVLKSRVA
jgi:hypothetical protein